MSWLLILEMKDNMLQKYKIVSFDLYDTLVNRLVQNSTDVFEMLSKKYGEIAGKEIPNFKSIRIEAEQRARKQGNGFISLEDIYNAIDQLNYEEKRMCIEIEKKIEYDIAYPNFKGKQLYNVATKFNKRIVVITDMYIGGELLDEILIKCGYSNIEKVYISGTLGYSKSNGGEIFDYVIKELKAKKDDVIHIGDNIKSDIVYARSKGIKTHYIYDKYKNTSPLERHINHTINEMETQEEQIGYRFFGSTILGFVKWIHDECVKKEVKDVYFFAREGRFFKEAYDQLFDLEDSIVSHYLSVSRRSLAIPLLNDATTYEELKDILFFNELRITIKQLNHKLGVEAFEEEICRRLETKGIHTDDLLINVDKDILFDILRPFINENSEDQLYYAKQYFQKSLLNGSKKIAIIDIGWTGMMQYNFIKLLKKCGINKEVEGFFLGQKPEIKSYINMGMHNHGYLCNYNDRVYINKILSGCVLLELIFHPECGTTLGYNYNGPILDQLEIGQDSIKRILLVQKGIISYVRKIGNIQLEYNIISDDKIRVDVTTFLTNPSLNSLDTIGDWEVNDEYVEKLLPRIKFGDYKAFYYGMMKTGWHVGYLKRNIRFNLPYYRIYEMLRIVWKTKEKREQKKHDICCNDHL